MIPMQAAPAELAGDLVPSVDWLAISPLIALMAGALLDHPAAVARAARLARVLRVASCIASSAAGDRRRAARRSSGTSCPTTARARRSAGMVRLDGFGVFLSGVIVVADAARAAPLVRLPAAGAPRRAGVLRADAAVGDGHDRDDDRQRPRSSCSSRSRSCRSRCTCSPPSTAAGSRPRRPASSTSCSARSRRRCFLYGIALVYGATGTTSLTGIADFLAQQHAARRRACSSSASRCCSSGSGSRSRPSPFHMWTPDVYQGAPTPVTAFMSSATKAAGFAALLRIFLVGIPAVRASTGARRSWASRCCRSSSGASPRSCRPT